MLNPWMLLGLLGLSLPVVIHLIQRQRMRPMPLATLALLDREDTDNAFAPLPKDMLQLFLRLLLMLLFIVLMARLVGCSASPGPRTLAVVVDCSMSMQQVDAEGRSLFERSRAAILDLVDGLRPEDSMSLTVVGDEVFLETGFFENPQALRAQVEAMRVGDGGGLGVAPAVRSAVDRLRSRRAVNSVALVYSSHRRGHYAHALDALRQAAGEANPARLFRQRLERGAVKLVFVDFGEPPEDNVGIESASFAPTSVFLGSSARFSARVRNHSDSEQTIRLNFFEEGRAGANRTVDLQPREAATVDVVHVFESPVDVPCHVELGEDRLPGDNRFFLPMRMRDRRQVLLVTPSEDDEARDDRMAMRARGADLFFYALNPGEALGRGAGTHVNVRRVTPAALERMSLPFYSVVVFYGVDALSERSRADLAAFVENGGGLYLIPDDAAGPVRFNRAFDSVLGGFALGQEAIHQPGQPLDPLDARLDEPLLTSLAAGEWGEVRHVSFRRYHVVNATGGGRVVLRAANGDPLAMMVPRGRGRVFVQLFTCSLDATSLPRSAAFVPMVQTVLAGLRPAERLEESETLRAGEMLRVPVPAWRGLEGPGELAGPTVEPLPMQDGRDEPLVRIAGLTTAGAYDVRHPQQRTGRRRWITVNPVAAESDLTRLDAADMAALFGDRRFAFLPGDEIGGIFIHRRELTSWLLLLLLPAFAVEALVGAWHSRRGQRRPSP